MICYGCKKDVIRGADIDENYYCVDCWAPLIGKKLAEKIGDGQYTVRVVKGNDK